MKNSQPIVRPLFVKTEDNQDRLMAQFVQPGLIGVVGDPDSGKSNLLYYVIQQLQALYDFKLYTYGLRLNIADEQKIYSLGQLEVISNSIIIIDEFTSMFDVDNRKEKKQIENTLRLLFHNNNVVLFCGLSENFKKFIASKLDAVIYKRCMLDDMINGSRVKKLAVAYRGYELGASVLNIDNDKALLFDGANYSMVEVPYIEAGDTKKKNPDILVAR